MKFAELTRNQHNTNYAVGTNPHSQAPFATGIHVGHPREAPFDCRCSWAWRGPRRHLKFTDAFCPYPYHRPVR